MIQRIRIPLACFFVCALGTFTLSYGAEAQRIFPVGSLFPMTGPQAYYGRMMSHGVLTAIDRINAAGGVEGYKLKLEIIDFQNLDVDLALSGLQKMVNTKQISFLLTSFSAITLAIQPICADKHILMVNGGAFSPELVNKPYLYSTKVIQTQTIPPMLEFLWGMHIRKIGIIYFDNPGGKVPAKRYVEPMWIKMGGTVVSMEGHQPGLTDYTPYLSRIKSGDADAIYDISTGQDQAYLIRNAREMGMNIPITISDWGTDHYDIAGNTSENVYVCGDHFDMESPDSAVRHFVKEYEDKWKEPPDIFSANYYEAVFYLLPELIRRVVGNGKDPMNGEELQKAIWMRPAFETLYGERLVLNQDGTCNKPMAIYKIVDGKKTVVKKITSK